VLAPTRAFDESDALDPVERFKASTLRKLEGVRCPSHGEAPAVEFLGTTLRDIRISMHCCCRDLSELANRAIARPVT